MFEGIIIGLGKVASIEQRHNFRRLNIDLTGLVSHVPQGGSVAINGTCLTSVHAIGLVHSFDVIEETLQKTNLGSLEAEDKVNVELPLKLGAEINGHLVQGHVDTTAKIVKKTQEGDNCRIWFSVPPQFLEYMVSKGSVAIDGISLTIVDVDHKQHRLSVALIPYTLSVTTLGFKNVGDLVNIEVDYQAKLLRTTIDTLISGIGERLDKIEKDISQLKE